jgi:hypothetical protein
MAGVQYVTVQWIGTCAEVGLVTMCCGGGLGTGTMIQGV